MNVVIVTDSTCDLPSKITKDKGIEVIPLTVTFGDKSFRDGIDMNSQAFFARLAKAEILPTTSQPAPSVFQACFRRHLDEGKEVFGIFISSELSGTYQSAVLARSGFTPEEQSRIVLMDSRYVTCALGILVLHAQRLKEQGASATEIATAIAPLTERTRLYAQLDTMKYLRMGGRVSAAVATAGGILNISPVISLVGGKLAAVDKIRKRPQVFFKWLRERMMSDLPDPTYGGIVVHSNDPQFGEALKEQFKYLFPECMLPVINIGAVVGTHVGPGAAGIIYIAKEKK